jgi:ribosomal protein L30E
MKFIVLIFSCFVTCLVCAACSPSTAAVSVTAYNHMARVPIYSFSVNGGTGGGNIGEIRVVHKAVALSFPTIGTGG